MKYAHFSFLRFPDDENKKNSACTPVPSCQEPVDWFQISHTANNNNDRIGKLLGIRSTGRLTYLSQCHYLGDGKIKSLLDEDIEYQVNLSTNNIDLGLYKNNL